MSALSTLLAVLLGAALLLGACTAVVRALGLVGELLWRYARLVVGVTRRRTPEFETIPPHRPQDEPVPAYRNYFFGPAARDLRQLLTLGPRVYGRAVGDRFRTLAQERFTQAREPGALKTAHALALCVGLAAGAAIAVPLIVLALLVHALAVLLLNGAARATAGGLRAVDRGVLTVRGLRRGVLCPHCYDRVPYPSYACPRESCRRRHSDIRPGRYGLFRRRCECGERMPTLVMLMRRRSRLPAFCTHARCGKPLNQDAGHAREIVLPMVGGRAAGKTQLMAAMLMSLEDAAGAGGPALRLADDETTANYQVLREVLEMKGHTRATQRTLLRAHSVVLGKGRAEQLVHVFDTAGEQFMSGEDADALRYVRAARTFVFVLDPLAVEATWQLLEESPAPAPDRTLASTDPPDVIFGNSSQTAARLGRQGRLPRLAVAISKTDLLAEHGLLPDRLNDSAAAREWLAGRLGLRNLVQAMELEFAEVRYFFTAAVTVEEGRVHASVGRFVDWCLDRRPRR
ncbi:TRAFAC clade GTPase domain-containing protein [Streptomyces sp. NPDC054861]